MRNLDHGPPGNATGLGFGLAPSLSGLLCKWADVSRAAGKTEQARQAAEEALALAKASHDTLHTTMAMFWLGYLADERGDHAEWEREITSAVTLLETLPPGEELLRAYWAMADVHALAASRRSGIVQPRARPGTGRQHVEKLRLDHARDGPCHARPPSFP